MSFDQPRWVVSGGIGCGKSAVRRLLETHGFFTVDADSVGHEVLAHRSEAFTAVARRWPEVVRDGEIDRSELAQIVFNDRAALQELEAITHPYIFGMIRDRVQGIPDPVAVEIPVRDHGLGEGWGWLIVDCVDQIRLRRLMSRGMGEDDASSRMQSQPSRAGWLAIADAVIPNHGGLTELDESVRSFLDGSSL